MPNNNIIKINKKILRKYTLSIKYRILPINNRDNPINMLVLVISSLFFLLKYESIVKYNISIINNIAPTLINFTFTD